MNKLAVLRRLCGWLLVAAALVTLNGCSAKSPHTRFQKNIGIVASRGDTIDQLAARGTIYAQPKNLIGKQVVGDKTFYHYKMPSLWGHCFYSLVADSKSGVVVDWQFDADRGDPLMCGSSG